MISPDLLDLARMVYVFAKRTRIALEHAGMRGTGPRFPAFAAGWYHQRVNLLLPERGDVLLRFVDEDSFHQGYRAAEGDKVPTELPMDPKVLRLMAAVLEVIDG